MAILASRNLRALGSRTVAPGVPLVATMMAGATRPAQAANAYARTERMFIGKVPWNLVARDYDNGLRAVMVHELEPIMIFPSTS